MRVYAIVVVYCGVRMQTCVPYQYDDQLTLAINTTIFRSHDTYARLVTVAVDAATSMLFCFVVCVTDDEESEIGACKNINAIVNCINCTPLTTLAQVTNAHSKIDPNTNSFGLKSNQNTLTVLQRHKYPVDITPNLH